MNDQPSLGEYLRQERERRGVTLEQVASATKISVRLLHALESDHYSDLPARPFVRGFVNSYSLFVGLEPRDVLTRYGRFLESETKTGEADETRYAGYAFEKRANDRSRMILWIVMGVCIVLGGLTMFLIKPVLRKQKVAHVQKLKNQKPAAAKAKGETVPPPAAVKTPAKPDEVKKDVAKAETQAPAETPAAKPSPKPTVVAEKKEEPPKEEEEEKDPLQKGDGLLPGEVKHKVVFKALTNVWVRYRVDDRKIMQFLLLGGKLLVLKSKGAIHFQASNEESIQVRYRSSQYVLLEDFEGVDEVNGNPTLGIARGGAELGAPFRSQKALPETPSPDESGA